MTPSLSPLCLNITDLIILFVRKTVVPSDVIYGWSPAGLERGREGEMKMEDNDDGDVASRERTAAVSFYGPASQPASKSPQDSLLLCG